MNITKYILITILLGSFSLLTSCVIDQICDVKINDFEIQTIDKSQEDWWNIENAINQDSLSFTIHLYEQVVRKKHKNKGCYELCYVNFIDSVKIKTLYDYSDIFLAGADVTSLFKGEKYYLDSSSSLQSVFIPIEELIVNLRKNDNFNNFGLFWRDKSFKEKKQKFEISIFLSDNTVITHQTNDLILK